MDVLQWIYYIVTFTAALFIVLGVLVVSLAEWMGWRQEKQTEADARKLLEDVEEWGSGL